MSDVTWLGEYQEDGVVFFRVGRRGDELIAEWPNVAVLRANPRLRMSAFEADASADPVLVDKVHRSMAQALLRHLDHKLTLHGSAVARGGKAVAMVGRSGAGKSTLAAALAREEGVAFAADDTLALDLDAQEVQVSPTERTSWLLPDACTALGVEAAPEKRAVDPPRFAEMSRLAAIVVPIFATSDTEPVALRRLRGLDILSALVPAVIRFVIDDASVQLREMEQLERLVARVPILALVRPRRLDALGETVKTVLTLLEETPWLP
jgi:hypothetical protein